MTKELSDFDLSLIALSVGKDEYSAYKLFTNITGKSTEDGKLYLTNLKKENRKLLSNLNRVEIIKTLDGTILGLCNNSNKSLAVYVYSELAGVNISNSEKYVNDLMNTQSDNPLTANINAIRQEVLNVKDSAKINKKIRYEKYDKVYPGISLIVLSIGCYLFFSYQISQLRNQTTSYLGFNTEEIQKFEKYSNYAGIALLLGIIYTIVAYYLAKNNKSHWLD